VDSATEVAIGKPKMARKAQIERKQSTEINTHEHADWISRHKPSQSGNCTMIELFPILPTAANHPK
jgi:hypothetical protein